MFERTRSRSIELLSPTFDRVKGFQLLTLDWSDDATFLPVNFSLVFYTKHLIQEISEEIKKRTSGYIRQEEAPLYQPQLTTQLVKQALNQGINVLRMIKRTPKRFYEYKGKKQNLMNLLP